ALHNAYKDKGLEIVGINKERVPAGKIKETIETFAKEMGINYPLVIGDDKVEESIPDFSGYPTTLFIDRAGKVRYKHVGYAPYEVLDYIVKTLLDEKPKTP
ncbi:MAG TPA: TlpA disulfide reductase family protein, partial [Isosphaeraceae bacterium]